jgi:hypothetical protein
MTDNNYHKQIRQKIQTIYNAADDPLFTEAEVTEIVNTQNNAKSPGEDGFNAQIIQNLHITEPLFLTKLYNKCLTLGVFPDKWKTCVVKIIRKSGNRDFRNAKSYRPISLLSVFAKILEKLIINRTMFYLKSNNLLDDNQYGFTPQKSTIDAIHSTVDFIRSALERKGFALLIAIDISGAFDNASWSIILECLRAMELPRNLFYLTKSYFSNRTAKLWLLNTQVFKKLSMGCPQGSASGPGYWNIIFNSCLKLKFAKDTEVKGFADDALLVSFAKSTAELQIKVNEALNLLSQWAVNNKLEFNASKTTAVLFTRNLKYNNPKI